MKQKIEWYKEVLQLEPGSRVFFPLAKMLASSGQREEAVGTLRQGLLRHPDHVEARLLLVELLYSGNETEAVQTEIANLGGIFSLYPGFWQAWSEFIAGSPAMKDAAMALRFFSAALQGRSLSWADVIEHGMSVLLNEKIPTRIQNSQPQAVQPLDVDIEESVEASFGPDATEVPEAAPADNSVEAQAAVMDEEFEPAPMPSEAKGTTPDPLDENHDADDDEPEEAFSLRTRSMADVLAEQGDISGALDIYHELMASAPSEEHDELLERIDELSHRQSSSSAPESKAGDDKNAQHGESARLVNLLESLAQRLETRAR